MKHCQVRWDEPKNGFCVLDMNSANGTFVNGRQIEADLALQDGDLIEIGNSKLMFSTQNFEDRESALNYFKQRGERVRSTLIR